MIEIWLLEGLKGIGKFFLHPLLYWSILLVIVSGNLRIKEERINFGAKVFDVFSEWRGTFWIALISGFILSVITLGLGIVVTYEIIIIMMILSILFSITMRFSLLSPIYTIGLTFILFIFLPRFINIEQLWNMPISLETNLIGLSILLGLLLIIESILIRTLKRNRTFPSLSLSRRGIWVGQHRLKRMTIIPFFLLLPNGPLTPIEPYWPYLTIGEQTYSILLIPFLIGFDFLAKGHMPMQAAKKLANSILLLGIGITGIAIGSIFIPWLSFVAVILAIVGKEYIHYRYRYGDRVRLPYFQPENEGLKIVSIIPGTPADRTDLLVGESIVKVNGMKVNNVQQFYVALQNSGAYFKLEVKDDNNEIRFVQGAYYEGDHHELGLIFSEKPYREKMKRVD